MSDDLFERARDVSIEAVAGVKLWRAGNRLRGECPSCGASKGKKADGAFSANPRDNLFYCFVCREGGNAIDLEILLRGGSPREAAERLVNMPLEAQKPAWTPREPEKPRGQRAVDRTAAAIWAEARRGRGTAVETYLHGRGIRGCVLEAALPAVRYHPRAFWGLEDDERTRVFAPAMVMAIETPSGLTGGIHVTYLAPGGRGKTDRRPAKRMWGPQTDLEGRKGGAWLIGPRAPGPVVVGEGAESTLSAVILQPGKAYRAFATLTLDRLQGGWLADRFGRIDPACIAPDPEKPPLTWPLADLDCGEVIVAVDRDMGPVKVKRRRPTGGTVEHVLSADERARICAGLAVAGWRRANPQLKANAVRAIGPGAGQDFSDELRERAFA